MPPSLRFSRESYAVFAIIRCRRKTPISQLPTPSSVGAADPYQTFLIMRVKKPSFFFGLAGLLSAASLPT